MRNWTKAVEPMDGIAFSKGYWMAMGVMYAVQKMLAHLIVAVCLIVIVLNTLDVGTDDTDNGGWHRSGVQLITDHKTGVQYLYRGGALVRREP